MIQSVKRGKDARDELDKQQNAATLIQARVRGAQARNGDGDADGSGAEDEMYGLGISPRGAGYDCDGMPQRVDTPPPDPRFMTGKMAHKRPPSALLSRMREKDYEWSFEQRVVLHASQLPGRLHVRGASSGISMIGPESNTDHDLASLEWEAMDPTEELESPPLNRGLTSSGSSRSLPELMRGRGPSRPLTPNSLGGGFGGLCAGGGAGTRRAQTPQNAGLFSWRPKAVVEYKLGEPLR